MAGDKRADANEEDTMSKLLRYVAFCASISVLSGMAAADPSVPGKTGKATPRAPVVSGPSPISKMSSVVNTTDTTCTVAGSILLAKTINLPATSDVGVHFQGEFFPGCRAFISLTRNGVVVPGPGDSGAPMAAHDTSGDLSTNGFNWVVKNVPAGNSVFRVTCECDSGSAIVDERSMILYHR